MKSEEATTFINKKKEKEKDKVVNNLIKEKLEWSRLRETHEQTIATKSKKVRSLEAQLCSFLIEGSMVMYLSQQVYSLKLLNDAQVAVIESSKGKIERLKAGIWNVESVCPPFKNLSKNYKLQRDIFSIVYSLKLSQVLEPSKFESLWEEVTNDGYEHLLIEILVRGELRLRVMFKGFQTIANMGIHVFYIIVS